MPSKRPLRGTKLYVIVDADACGGRDPVAVAADAVAGGADVIQWRAKTWIMRQRWEIAERLAQVLRPTEALFIVNDHLELALAAGADGVHLGQEDLPVAVARRLAGSSLLVGVSTHSMEQALAAQDAGADYLGVGPVFATPTKPDSRPVGLELVRAAARQIQVPWVAIGGIDQSNLALVLSSGATRVAVVRAVAAAPDVRRAAQTLNAMLR